METLFPLIIQLVSGILGGNAAGQVMKDLSLGPVGNSIAGLLGGGLGGQILGMLGMAAGGGTEVADILASIASGGVGGGVLLAVVGMVRKMLNK